MKVLLHYEDNEESEKFKSLKITLPKSWKTGPTSKLLEQFVESYNASKGQETNLLHQLVQDELHLALRNDKTKQLESLPSDAIVLDVIPDRADVYICHGKSQSLTEIQAAEKERKEMKEAELKSTVPCIHFGCKNRFPPNGPFPSCVFHKSPPVFHETAKFWSCCPQKKAYDWDSFQEIPGCQTGTCTNNKDESSNNGQPTFLGGMDLREQAGEAVKLKSIDDFNKTQAAGGANAAPVLERLQSVLLELGIEAELYRQVVDGIQNDLQQTTTSSSCCQTSQANLQSESQLLDAVKDELGSKLKAFLKATAAEQLRIN